MKLAVVDAWHRLCGAGGEVVAGRRATWPGVRGGRTPPEHVATRFAVRGGRVHAIDRHAGPEAALAAGGPTLADEVTAAGG